MSGIKILKPKEAKKKALAKVEQWKKDKRKKELEQKIEGKKLPTEPPQAAKAKPVQKSKKNLTSEEQEELNEQLIGVAKEGEIEKVKGLLDRGADVNAKDNDGNTALIRVSNEDHMADVIKLLIKNGADVNITGDNERNALDYALARNDKKAVKLLKKHGAVE